MSKFIYIIALTILAPTLIFGQVVVSMKIDTNQIYIGEQVLLKLKVSANANQVIVMPQYPDSQLVKGVEVLSHYTDKSEKLDGGRRISITEAYRITSFDSSLYYIPPIEVQVDDKQYKSSQGLALKVITPNIDTTKVDKIYGPMENAQTIYTWSDLKLPFYIWLFGLVLLVISVYIALQIKSNHRIVPKIILKPEGPPHKIATKRINRLKQKLPKSAEEIHYFYSELTDIIRVYITKRFGFKATAMTTNQVLDRLKNNTPAEMLDELRNLFQATDLIKYAGINNVVGDCGKNILVATEYINATKNEKNVAQKKIKKTEAEVARSFRMRLILTIVNSLVFIVGFAFVGRAMYIVYDMIF